MKNRTNPDTCLHTDIAERAFMQKVRCHAAQTVNNYFAGCTTAETQFIHKYYLAHKAQRFTDAIIQCTHQMLEQFRSSELRPV